MRTAASLIPGLLILLSVGTALGATQLAGKRAPDFALKSFGGENLRLSEHRGDVVVLAFWAAWCSDCRDQLSGIADLNERFGDAGLTPLAVSMDRNTSSLREDVAAYELGYPMLDDATLEVSRGYDVESLPVALMIDREGVVREVVEGYGREIESLYAEFVERLLAE
ncbi:MAG TPA: peroxiredoxin family protein [Gammaproteobacteria bacterium]